jgi:hypothetical protein
LAHDIVGNGCHHFFDVSLIERGRFSKTSVTGGAAPSWMRGASLPPPAEEARRLRSSRRRQLSDPQAPSWTPAQEAREAARGQGLRLPSMPQGFEEEGHNPADSQAGHRIRREAGSIQVGRGTNSVVDELLPVAEGTLRAPRGHPSGIPRSRMRSHLLRLRSAVMLGALDQSAAKHPATAGHEHSGVVQLTRY